jgi:hypothetical protein
MTNEDVKYEIPYFEYANGHVMTNPTDFILAFYIENRKGIVTCSRSGGGQPVNCKIDTDGKVTCFLPKNSFCEGCLMFEVKWTVNEADFPGGTFTFRGKFNTNVRYEEGTAS